MARRDLSIPATGCHGRIENGWDAQRWAAFQRKWNNLNIPIPAIADDFDLSERRVSSIAKRNGLASRAAVWANGGKSPDGKRVAAVIKVRGCLTCLKPFQSSGPGNRVCESCKSTAAWRAGDGGDYTVCSTGSNSRRAA